MDLESLPGSDPFVCPIGRTIMRNPVLAADGFHYDRINLENALAASHRSPLTGKKISNRDTLKHDKTFMAMYAHWIAASEPSIRALTVDSLAQNSTLHDLIAAHNMLTALPQTLDPVPALKKAQAVRMVTPLINMGVPTPFWGIMANLGVVCAACRETVMHNDTVCTARCFLGSNTSTVVWPATVHLGCVYKLDSTEMCLHCFNAALENRPLSTCTGIHMDATWRVNLMVIMVPKTTHHDTHPLHEEWEGTLEYPDLGPDVKVAWCKSSRDTTTLCIKVDSVVAELLNRPWPSVILPAHMWPAGISAVVTSVLERLNVPGVTVSALSCNTQLLRS